MKKLFFYIFIVITPLSLNAQNVTATFYESGVNSPWTAGIDYDFGFGKLFSLNIQITGGINSQVAKTSTFGDVFMGELQIGPRLYMNKFDKWEGLYLSPTLRFGVYNIPIRTRDEPFTESSRLIIDRGTMLLYGFGVYIGYKWQRNLVVDMSNLPFTLVLEPYIGWSWDGFINLSVPSNFTQNGININRFTVGLSFKIGFYTYKKSSASLTNSEDSANTSSSKTNE